MNDDGYTVSEAGEQMKQEQSGLQKQQSNLQGQFKQETEHLNHLKRASVEVMGYFAKKRAKGMVEAKEEEIKELGTRMSGVDSELTDIKKGGVMAYVGDGERAYKSEKITRRSTMTGQQKSAFLRSHGMQEYMKIPY